MGLFYFDLETFSKGLKPNAVEDDIISMQFQELNPNNGSPIGELEIVKGWEVGEKGIIEKCRDLVVPWKFIPVGVNLAFDFLFLREKFRKYGFYEVPGARFKWFIRELPYIDLKHVLVLANGCRFKGYNSILGKNGENASIRDYYIAQDFLKIIDYIKRESEATIKLFKTALEIVPEINNRIKD